ncbi:MAG: metallopeptidase TldD-related protein, partial [Chitinophagales bacterium]
RGGRGGRTRAQRRSADEGRSFLTKKGGGNKIGEKIMDERISIYTDPYNTESPISPWAQDGQANKKVDLIKNGVVANMLYDRFWAAKKNVAPVPFPGNVIMDGGTASLEDMIRDTKKGILVTRFWYVRSVDPQTQLYTGLTRDGTFFIENGKIKYPVKNFRFNESPVIMFNNLETLGKQVRIGRSLGPSAGGSFYIPAVKVRDFTFTSLSDAV